MTGSSQVEATRLLIVGDWGQGTLTISDGGQVNGGEFDVEIGEWETGTGTVEVTGAGSQLQGYYLHVGAFGTGTLIIRDGGQVNSFVAWLGHWEASTGTVEVTGMDSMWVIDGNLSIGYEGRPSGKGLLTVGDGAQVNVGGKMTIGYGSALAGDGTVTMETPTALQNYGKIAPGSADRSGL